MKKHQWYWGSEKPGSNKFLLIDIILDNFNHKKYQKQYHYLKRNIDILSQEIINLRNFFEQINQILILELPRDKSIKKICNLRDRNKKKFIDKHVAEVILDNLEFNYNYSSKQKGGSNVKYLDTVKNNLETKYKSLHHLLNYGQKGGESVISDSFDRFTKQNETNINNNQSVKLNQLPIVFKEFTEKEYKIPLNLNDILLIGFSLLPHIGWIFDIFMIFRSLIEKRYIYAILVTINLYQYLFNKLISFGLLGINFSPIIKLFYLAPYASKDFNLKNIKFKLSSFLESININFNKELSIS